MSTKRKRGQKHRYVRVTVEFDVEVLDDAEDPLGKGLPFTFMGSAKEVAESILRWHATPVWGGNTVNIISPCSFRLSGMKGPQPAGGTVVSVFQGGETKET